MQQPKEYYQAQMSRLTILLKKHRQRRNGITLAKVFLFLLAIYFYIHLRQHRIHALSHRFYCCHSTIHHHEYIRNQIIKRNTIPAQT